MVEHTKTAPWVTEEPTRLEVQLRATLNVIPAYTWYALPSGALTFVNERTADYLGLPKENPLRLGIERDAVWDSHIRFLHPDDREETRTVWSTCLRTGAACEVVFRVRNAEGGYRWFLSRAEPVRSSDGTVLYWIGVNLDIDDAKRAEQALQHSEAYSQQSKARLEEAQGLAHIGYWEWDLATDQVTWADETYRIYGLTPQDREIGITQIREMLHPDDRDFVFRTAEEALRGGMRPDVEHRVVRPDGEVRVVHSQGDIKRDASGQPCQMFGTVQDITDRRHAEESLRQSQFYLSEGQRLAHMGSWSFNAAGFNYWSPELLKIHGLHPNGKPPTVKEYLDLVHPDDRAFMEQGIQKMLADHSGFDFTKRIMRPDGNIRYVRCVGVPVINAATLQGFVGTGMDVTEQEQLTEDLRKSETEFRQMLDLVPQLVLVFGSARERIYANHTALDYLGVSLEKWRQTLDMGEFVHPDDRAQVRAFYYSALSSGTAYELEYRVRKGDGSYRWFLTRYNPLRDEQGKITRWYCAFTDIEDRKRAEEKLQQENVALREEVDQTSMFEEIIGTSPALQTVLGRVSKVAPSDSTVLVTGETGTGKELLARAIHRRSRRMSRPFVSVNCAAIPRDLIASELFGHEKGAFTGATQRHLGRFELADDGTIFLDEVGELLPDTQVALLRVLQEREFERVGGGHPIHVNVRVIAATNRDLAAAVANGTFRQDLFYRLNVFPIEVPALRERREDILMLVEYFVQRYASRAGKNIHSIDKKTLDLLQCYDWPGNIRELQNVIERSVILSSGEVFSVDELWLSQETSRSASQVKEPQPVNDQSEPRSEREIIEAALTETRGRVSGPSGAAAKLRIPPSTLAHRIKALKINKKQFKFL